MPAPVESASRPGAHAAQEVPPVRSEKVRRGQGEQAVAPKPVEIEPIGHAVQARMELAVAEVLKVPGKHCVQKVAPGSAQDPNGQHTVAPGGLKVPLAQGKQDSAAAFALYVFAGQLSQEKYCPLTAVYTLPGSQGKQLGTPATLPKPGVSPAMKPAAQHTPHPAALTMPPPHAVQAEGALAPTAALARPEGHWEHAASPVPPSAYVPGAQGEQAAAPLAAVKLPAPQELQLLLPLIKE